jgi:HAD superfamily hydrolase (TIGR01509 family)
METGAGLIIFDCDGVLVDSEPLAMRILLATISEAGGDINSATAYRAFLGKSLASICELLRRDYGLDIGAAALEHMRERLYATISRELQPMAGIDHALRNLKQRYCVASSSQLERIRLSLAVTGLCSYFDANVFSATMVNYGKPAPDLFLYAARHMEVEPADCIVVEDSPAGIAAALDAGMNAFGFTGGSHARSISHHLALEEVGALLVFDDMHELPRLVGALETYKKLS